MIKTEVPGLVIDGKGAAVQQDMTAYYDMLAKRKAKLEMEALRDEVALLRAQLAELHRAVEELRESSK